MSTITYVTALFDLQEPRPPSKSIDNYISLFEHLVSTGVYICLYVSPKYKNYILDAPNITIIELELADTQTFKITQRYSDLRMPDNRNTIKDSKNFLICMNSKTELIMNTIITNPYNTSHFAWIDFGIYYIFKSPELTLKFISNLCITNKQPFVAIPGCWRFGRLLETVTKHVNWRFCGGFLIGDCESMRKLCKSLQDGYEEFLSTTNYIVWEVNIWAWLESKRDLGILWYEADHNDSIICNLPILVDN